MKRHTCVLVAATLAAACASGDRSAILEAYQGLCTSLAAADAGDLDLAATTFTDEAHEGLHLLADRLLSVDRSTAAGVLRAKQRVEAAVSGDRTMLSQDLRTLAETARLAIGELGNDPPETCTP